MESLIELGLLLVKFKATAEMEADFLAKFMGAQLLGRQRQLCGMRAPARLVLLLPSFHID